MTFNLNKIYTANEFCAHTAIADKSIILNIENGQYYELNSTSSLIWGLLNEKKTVAEIISIISNEYNVEDKVISKSVTEFLNSCLKLNFIQELE